MCVRQPDARSKTRQQWIACYRMDAHSLGHADAQTLGIYHQLGMLKYSQHHQLGQAGMQLASAFCYGKFIAACGSWVTV